MQHEFQPCDTSCKLQIKKYGETPPALHPQFLHAFYVYCFYSLFSTQRKFHF